MNTTISEYMRDRQKRCDSLFSAAEQAVGSQQWDTAHDSLSQYCDALEEHLAMEEKVVFPAYEAETSLPTDATGTLRAEHREFRSLMRRLEDAISQRDEKAYLEHSRMLDRMLREHERKEGELLYPLIDTALAGRNAELILVMKEAYQVETS